MNATRVLVIEDDPNIVDLVRSNLTVRGFEVDVSTDGEDAADRVRTLQPEICLLDLMLPRRDGFEILRELRQEFAIGLIVVSARANEADKVRALNLGADDYLTKPFGIEELLARMTATLRRTRVHDEEIDIQQIDVGNIHIDLESQSVHRSGERVQLTPTEFSLLRYLALNKGVLLSYDALLREVWGRGYENSREYVRVYVGRLRAKLEDSDGPSLIVTEPRAGYRLVDPEST